MSIASDVSLNLETQILATMSDLQIDPSTLFPDLSQENENQREVQDREVKDTVNKQPKKEKVIISRKDKIKKEANYKKTRSTQKNK